MSKKREAAERVRAVLHEAILHEEKVQNRLDQEAIPREGLRSSIFTSRLDFWAGIVIACGLAWITPWIITWLLGLVLDISTETLRIVFWFGVTVSTSYLTAIYFISSIGDNALYWAKQHERADRAASSLLSLFEELEEALPNSVPDLARYRNWDLHSTNPIVDAAMRGVNQK